MITPLEPAAFLQLGYNPGRLAAPDGIPLLILFDLGVSAALAGQIDKAINLLLIVTAKLDYDPMLPLHRYASEALTALRTDSDLAPILTRISAENPKI